MALNSSFPNPDTYLNHLPPANGHEFEITRNIYLAILGVCLLLLCVLILEPTLSCQASIWDALLYIPDDIKIISNDFGIVTFCFIFARCFFPLFMRIPNLTLRKRVFATTYALLFVLVTSSLLLKPMHQQLSTKNCISSTSNTKLRSYEHRHGINLSPRNGLYLLSLPPTSPSSILPTPYHPLALLRSLAQRHRHDSHCSHWRSRRSHCRYWVLHYV